jgi:hypothetical protein
VFADLAVTDRELLAEMQIIWVRNNLVVQCAEQYPALRVPVKHTPPNPFARKPVPLGSGQAETELLPTDIPSAAASRQSTATVNRLGKCASGVPPSKSGNLFGRAPGLPPGGGRKPERIKALFFNEITRPLRRFASLV